MAGTKRNKRPMKTFIILAVSIGAMNLMGMSYASWNDGLKMHTTLTTGNLNYEVRVNGVLCGSSKEDDMVQVMDVNILDGQSLSINIKNTGTVPMIVNSLTVNDTVHAPIQDLVIDAESDKSESINIPLEIGTQSIQVQLSVRQYTD